MHRNSVLIKIQPDATVCRYLFTAKTLFMFRVSQHPSSGVLKTVTASSGTGHNTGSATSLQRGLIGTGLCDSHKPVPIRPRFCDSHKQAPIRPRWREVALPILWPVPEAAVTVFSTPDDGCCDTRDMKSDFAVNKHLYTVASVWIFINTEFLCITHTVEHNYISPSSTVGIQLHVSALYFGHLQIVT